MLRDAGGQLAQRLIVEGLAGLAGVRLDLPQGQSFDFVIGLKAGGNVLK